MEYMTVNDVKYEAIRLLGKGKGGYSYLVRRENQNYVLKQIHHEPCSYYTFGNKLEAEKNDYKRLASTGILLPKMLEVDEKNERILKEYIDGPTIYDLVKNDQMKEEYLLQMKKTSELLASLKINIDYYPTNFVVENDKLYYIDYECNDYMEEWSFNNWGIKYWSKTKEFLETIKE